jgi:ornithine--oxo-acid transaminase
MLMDCRFINEYFGFDMVLPMNTGAEAVETSLKLARKWAYTKKGVPEDRALMVSVSECFHGRTLGIVSMSEDPDAREGFGPFMPGLRKVPFDDLQALEQLFEREGKYIAGLLLEPIQGEAG